MRRGFACNYRPAQKVRVFDPWIILDLINTEYRTFIVLGG
jgi:hypothetical protein